MRAEAPAEPQAPLMGSTSTGSPMEEMHRRPAGRPFRTFTFPTDFAAEIMKAPEWVSSSTPFTLADLTFGLTTATLSDELEASKDGGRGVANALILIQRTIVMIGGKKNLDYTYKQDWLAAIGSKGRAVVIEMYWRLNNAGDDVGNFMLANASDWTV